MISILMRLFIPVAARFRVTGYVVPFALLEDKFEALPNMLSF